MTLLGRLKYLYVGSQDADADVAHWRSLGLEPEWDYKEFGTRVAGFRIGDGPLWIVAGHRPPGVLPVFVVPDAETTRMNLEVMGWQPEEGPFELPDGPCYLYRDPSGNQIAVVGEVRPEAEEHLRAGMTKGEHLAASDRGVRP